jgi:hypothetical protein
MVPRPKPRILVVDEESDLRDLLPSAFRDRGLSFTVVDDILLAKMLIWTERVDLIVIDPIVLRERGDSLLAYAELLCIPVLPLPGSFVYLEREVMSRLGARITRVRRIADQVEGAVRRRRIHLAS